MSSQESTWNNEVVCIESDEELVGFVRFTILWLLMKVVTISCES